MSLVTGLFFLVLLLNQRSSFTLQYFPYYVWRSKYSCLCSESIECFPGTASKFFLTLLVTIPVAPIITGTIVHFRFHIRCMSIHKPMYFSFFSASFCTTFLSAGIATSISVHVFSLLFLIILSGLFAVTYYYYYYYVLYWHTPFLLGTSPLEPMPIPTDQLPVSHCTTSRITRVLISPLPDQEGNKLGSMSGTRAISTTSKRELSLSFFSCKARRRKKFTPFWQKH